jgi:hypothetical protein
MTDRTHSQPAVTGWQHFDQPTALDDDMLRAAVTHSYWPRFSVSVAPPDLLLTLLVRVKRAAK